MIKVIIVGAGDTGLEVARRIKNSVLVEADPGKFMMLRREHPDWTIVGGDASESRVLEEAGIENAEYLLLSTNKDIFNLKIALSAEELGDAKIIAVLHDEKNSQELKDAGVDFLISPISETIDAIVHHLIPVGEDITEVAISQQSPALGKRVKDIVLPQDCTIGAILRGHHLIRPDSDTVLLKGDVISLVSLGALESDVVDAITGAYHMTVPIDRFIALFIDEKDMLILKEILVLASRVMATCLFIMPEKLRSFVPMIRGKCEKYNLKASFDIVEGNIYGRYKQVVEDSTKEMNDMFIIPQRKVSLLRYHIPSHYIESLINASKHSFYFPKSRRFKRFKRVLHHIDGSHHSGLCANYAVGMARVNRVPLKSLVVHVPDNTFSEEILIHTKRIGKVYGVEVIEVVVDGNPTLEFIQEVRNTANQLVVINWNCKTLRRDILRKIVHEAEASVLLVR